VKLVIAATLFRDPSTWPKRGRHKRPRTWRALSQLRQMIVPSASWAVPKCLRCLAAYFAIEPNGFDANRHLLSDAASGVVCGVLSYLAANLAASLGTLHAQLRHHVI